MNKELFKLIKKEWDIKTDRERWGWLLRDGKRYNFTVNLDNDDTFLTHDFLDDEYLSFDGYIGWTDCVMDLLSEVNIKCERV
jgi:hypothetical protein